MKTCQFKLTPISSFHGFPSSDTLFGAICWGIKRVYNESRLLEILKDYESSPVFIITSTFPYLEFQNYSLPFYPRPIFPGLSATDIKEISGDDKKEKTRVITEYKKFKKAEYVSDSIFKKILNGVSEKELFDEYIKKHLIMIKKMLLTTDEANKILKEERQTYCSEMVQKNAIDRLSMSTGEEGQTFYQGEYFVSSIFKLHFLVKTEKINFFNQIFRYLEDKGIGGNRSTGKGRFKIEFIKELEIGKDSLNKFITLSRYIPQKSEVSPVFYEVFACRSKVDSDGEFKGEDVWKARVMYFKEGSIFTAKERREFYGRAPVVKRIDGQKIYQNGFAFPVFGNIGGSK